MAKRRRPLLRAINRFFETADRRIFGRKELEQIVVAQRQSWHLPKSTSIKQLVTKVLLGQTDLKEVRLAFPGRSETRYIWKRASPFEVALSVRTNAYLSHYTAMHLHGLTDAASPNIYVNLEQSPKPEPFDALSQTSIDAAFKRSARITSQLAAYDEFVIHLLNGKHTRQLGVVDLTIDGITNGRITSIERTLVDAAVRPQYSGGTAAVLRAYVKARNRFSIERLVEILNKLDYRYPYHQAIGFYLERSQACRADELNVLRKMPLEFDFYLDNRIVKKRYDERWRIFYPEGHLIDADV